MGTIHFTLDKSCGNLLMQVALEKLYNLNLSGAIETFTESLGCSPEVSIKILLGDYILYVASDLNCMFNVVPKEDAPSEILKDYPQIDLDLLNRKLLELFQDYRDLEYDTVFDHFLYELKDIEEKVITNPELSFEGIYSSLLNFDGELEGFINIKYRKLIKLIVNNKADDLFSTIDGQNSKDYRTANRAYCYIGKANFIVENRDKILEIAEFLEKVYPDVGKYLKINLSKYIDRIIQFLSFISDLDLNDSMLSDLLDGEDIVSKHIKAAIDIDKALKNFSPSVITDNYNAGWLGPDGTFFGLNGEVSNLLHITLADEIFKYYEWPDPEFNQSKDWCLDDRGFVKIQGNLILFSGYSYELLGRALRKLTQRQIDKIYEYGKECWGGVLQFGYRKTPLEVSKFVDLSDTELEDLFTN